MTLSNWMTILFSAGAAVAPVVFPIIPPPWNLVVAAVAATATNLYHLFQPSPSAPPSNTK